MYHSKMRRWLVNIPIVLLLSAASALAVQVHSSAMFDADTLLKDLQVLSSDQMQGRRVDTPGSETARRFIVERFKASGIQPIGDSYLEPFTYTPQPRRGQTAATAPVHGVNVVGWIPGRQSPGRYIVVSAHYDHLGMLGGRVFNGADDNASGTASLFSIATYFIAHPPQNSLLFVAFDAEEPGLKGSQAFVAAPPVEKNSIIMNVNIDMIGREPNNRLFAVGAVRNPFLRPYIASVAAKAPVSLLMAHDDPSRKDPEDWSNDSDHASFQRAGIPAVYIGVEDYAQHHQATDHYETMSLDFFVRAVETSILLIDTFDRSLDAIARRSV
jgi:Zn-dependent M28 family amino/carboxypeptidase